MHRIQLALCVESKHQILENQSQSWSKDTRDVEENNSSLAMEMAKAKENRHRELLQGPINTSTLSPSI
jgi:hypothetical protein